MKQGEHVLDEAAIYFTNSLYKKLFNGYNICDAFIEAKEDVEFKFEFAESDLFMLLTQDGEFGPKNDNENKKNEDGDEIKHVCAKIRKPDVGSLQCNSDHIQVKEMPDKLNSDLKYRE